MYNYVKKLDKRGDILEIKERRKSKNLTQENIASLLKVGRTTVAMWETGESMPRADKLPQLAKILGCTVDDLLNDASTQHKN